MELAKVLDEIVLGMDRANDLQATLEDEVALILIEGGIVWLYLQLIEPGKVGTHVEQTSDHARLLTAGGHVARDHGSLQLLRVVLVALVCVQLDV